MHRCASVPKEDAGDDLMSLLKAQIVQDGVWRKEEHRNTRSSAIKARKNAKRNKLSMMPRHEAVRI